MTIKTLKFEDIKFHFCLLSLIWSFKGVCFMISNSLKLSTTINLRKKAVEIPYIHLWSLILSGKHFRSWIFQKKILYFFQKKISIYNSKITIFNSKKSIFNFEISIFDSKISIFKKKIRNFTIFKKRDRKQKSSKNL